MSERFTVETMSSGEPVIWDDDFGWDATIKVCGDFYGPDKVYFLKAIADALNAATLPTRPQWESENRELAEKIMMGGDGPLPLPQRAEET